jgi:aminoglycoside phosphotransferase (APT) family kinase protein
MHELTADTAAVYLREKGWIGDGPAQIETLSGGVSNLVLRVETAAQRFILKQSRPQLRTRDAWFSDVARIFREQETMQTLAPLLPPGVVPAVLHSDRANYLFTMSHAPPDAEVWKAQLLAGQVEMQRGEEAGRILGCIHEVSAANPAKFEHFADRTVFEQLRVEPYYVRIQERRPEVAGAVAPLIEQMQSAHLALCHGDFSPKNLLAHAAGFTLVDYETAHFGEPAMDLGFFLSHLLLKAAKHLGARQRYFDLTQAFWRGYSGTAEQLRRGIPHLGACLLARIDGTSPVDYLPEEAKREAVRQLGRGLLLDQPRDWNAVLELAESAYKSLARVGA